MRGTCAAAQRAQVFLNALHVTTGMGRAPLFDGDTKSTLASNITLHTGNISVLSVVTAVNRLDAVRTHFQRFHRLFRAFLAGWLVLLWSVQEHNVPQSVDDMCASAFSHTGVTVS